MNTDNEMCPKCNIEPVMIKRGPLNDSHQVCEGMDQDLLKVCKSKACGWTVVLKTDHVHPAGD